MTPTALAASSRCGTTLVQAQCARCMKRNPFKRSLKEIRALYRKARDRYALAKNRTALAKGVPLSQSGTTSANSSTSSSGEMVLIAYYGYDPNNRRTYRLLYGTTTWWSYDGWRIAEEMDGGTSNFPAQRVHLDGIGIDEHLATWAAGTGWTWRSYLQNHQSSTMRLLDGNGALLQGFEYDAYGNPYAYDSAGAAISTSAIDGAGIYGYTGRRLDAETGFYYFRNRYLNVGLGRFLTLDPSGLWKDKGDLDNGYSVFSGNGLLFIDSTGNKIKEIDLTVSLMDESWFNADDVMFEANFHATVSCTKNGMVVFERAWPCGKS
ncbi:MAG TPA: hypothetical protein ENK02_14870 [Planctomycetes bacterium]|nr:hypothetical protein [Planctomycetota bacterium]